MQVFFMENLAKQAIESLEAKRKSLGLTRQKLFKLAGVCESSYYHWMKGRWSPTLSVLQRLDNACEKHKANATK